MPAAVVAVRRYHDQGNLLPVPVWSIVIMASSTDGQVDMVLESCILMGEEGEREMHLG